MPVDSKTIEKAKAGQPEIVLTPNRLVPVEWFPQLEGCNVLLLAGGGGQQAPTLAATGANVTVVDLSDAQLKQDQLVAQREGLKLTTIRSSAEDLSMLADEAFDLIVHPCSNSFFSNLQPVWQEAARVLKPGGTMLTGFCSPVMFLFDFEELQQGRLTVRYPLPYSDVGSLPREQLDKLLAEHEPLMFGHTLTEQIGGQLAAGFVMSAMYEDRWSDNTEPLPEDSEYQLLDKYCSSFIATRCEKRP